MDITTTNITITTIQKISDLKKHFLTKAKLRIFVTSSKKKYLKNN